MKYLLTTLAIAILSLASREMFATGVAQKSPGDPTCDQAALQGQFWGMNMTAGNFIALTPKEIAIKTGIKMSWGKRILFKIVQKRIRKQLAKGIQPPKAAGEAGGASTMGVISAICAGLGGVGLLVGLSTKIFLLFVFGSAFVILGLIFGIIGLKKDKNKGAAILGTALSVVMLVIGLLVFLKVLREGD